MYQIQVVAHIVSGIFRLFHMKGWKSACNDAHRPNWWRFDEIWEQWAGKMSVLFGWAMQIYMASFTSIHQWVSILSNYISLWIPKVGNWWLAGSQMDLHNELVSPHMPHISFTPISKALRRSCTPYVYIYIINIHIKVIWDSRSSNCPDFHMCSFSSK